MASLLQTLSKLYGIELNLEVFTSIASFFISLLSNEEINLQMFQKILDSGIVNHTLFVLKNSKD